MNTWDTLPKRCLFVGWSRGWGGNGGARSAGSPSVVFGTFGRSQWGAKRAAATGQCRVSVRVGDGQPLRGEWLVGGLGTAREVRGYQDGRAGWQQA